MRNEADEAALQSENFSPSDYIREKLGGARAGDEALKLKQMRKDLKQLDVETQEVLNNNVFKNYQQFIDAAKEVSLLEREIYQLSSLLLDQKQTIESLMQMIGDDKLSMHTVSSHSTTSATNSIQFLMQKMDGIGNILNHMSSTEKVILHGEMDLLDVDTKQPLQRHMLILLSHMLLIGNSTPSGKFLLESSLSLNNVSAVNVKDRESGATNAGKLLKLLIFPEQRYYRCESARMKKLWLDEVEQAKRNVLHEGSLVRQATIRGKRLTVKEKASKLPSIDHSILAEEEEEVMDEADQLWLAALPAEVDEYIAHRDLEKAVELIMEWKQVKRNEMDVQLMNRENQIVQLLIEDVSRPGAIHGGPRAMKKARTLLTLLGRGAYATDAYLRRRSAMQRTAMKEVTVSEEPISYVRQLCNLYANAVQDIVNEYRTLPQYYSQILKWCTFELSNLLQLVKRHVIEVAPTMTVLAHTWKYLLQTMEELTNIGCHLNFEVNRLLGDSLEQAIKTNFESLMQGMMLRISEERWKPYVLESETALARLVEELSDVEMNMEWAIATDADDAKTLLNVSPHVVHFARMAHTLARDLAQLRSSPAQVVCETYAEEMWMAYLKHLSDSIRNGSVYAYSTTFILTQALVVCDRTLYGEEGELTKLVEMFPKLIPYANDSDEEGLTKEDEEVALV